MTLELQCDKYFPLTHDRVTRLLDTSCAKLGMQHDGHVTVRCVSSDEMIAMNSTYRHKNSPTNVLTFSYDEHEHDIAICMDVASKEARERSVDLVDYTALLLTHAFLHALGMDHEHSQEEAEKTQELEQQILSNEGFSAVTLLSV